MRTRISDRGQITVPKEVRDRLGIKGGTELEFETEGGRIIVTKVTSPDRLRSVVGILKDERRTDEVISELRGEPDTGQRDSA